MFAQTAYLPPGVVFTNPYTPIVAYWHQAAGDAAAGTIDPLQVAAAPTIAGIDPGATTIDDHAGLNQLVGNGWTSAANDQTQLSVDDQLAPDGTITGHLATGSDATNQDITAPPPGVGIPPTPEPKPRTV